MEEFKQTLEILVECAQLITGITILSLLTIFMISAAVLILIDRFKERMDSKESFKWGGGEPLRETK